MFSKPLDRRTVLRGAGVSLALPFLEAMRPRRASAQLTTSRHFVGFFYPNGSGRNVWVPEDGPLTEQTLSPALVDLAGFEAEGEWPAGGATYEDIAVIGGIDHSGVSLDIHEPALALCAHKSTGQAGVPGAATLDQVIAEEISGDMPYRNLALSASNDQNIVQGNISFREAGVASTPIRNPSQLFNQLFATEPEGPTDNGAERRASLLDFVREDAARLERRLGAEDKYRVDEYLTSISELEKQLESSAGGGCEIPDAPGMATDWHAKTKLFIDLGVLAMACGLTRVVTIQYSDSWGVHYGKYDLGEGIEGLSDWSDHFISHKLGDTDRATDLDALPSGEASRIANLRVLTTGRFKARRFAYLVEKLKSYPTASGTLFDDTLAMFCSENGDGDSHSRADIPILLAGHVGGFETGRALTVRGNTGALHASILGYYGIEASNYGNPMGNPIAGI